MITILHGEDIVKSRRQLEVIKNQHRDFEIISLDGKKLDLTGLKQALESASMFKNGRLVVIENFLASKNKNQEEIIKYLADEPPGAELVLWEGVSFEGRRLLKLKGARVLEFKPEPVFFRFLDSIRPNNTKEMLTLLLQSKRVEQPEIIFYMLIRQFRLLLLIKDGVFSGIEEIDRLAPWQKQKLERQARYFSLEQLVDIYHQLFKIDCQQKTGENTFDLAKTLEFFVAKL